MLRRLVAMVVLISAVGLAAGGCRSCSSCHDYDGPVADCPCGGGRAGSAFTGNCDGGCTQCSHSACGCESGGCTPANAEYGYE